MLHTPLSLISADCTSSSSAGSHKIITPQSIHVHPKQSKVITKQRQAVAYEIVTSSLYKKKKMAKKEHNDGEIKKKEEKAAERKARAEEKKKNVTATVTVRK